MFRLFKKKSVYPSLAEPLWLAVKPKPKPMTFDELRQAINETVDQLNSKQSIGTATKLDEETKAMLRKHLDQLLTVEQARACQVVFDHDDPPGYE